MRVVVASIIFVVLGGGMVGAALASPAEYARLGKGMIGHGSWEVWIEDTPRERAGPEAYCLSTFLSRPGRFDLRSATESYECGRVSEEFPVVQTSSDSSGKREHTVYAAVFSPKARTAMFNLGRLGRRKVNLKRLSATKAAKVGIEPVAYWTHGFVGHTCLHRLVVFDAQGDQLSDSGPLFCESRN